jgi:hypothetical protein
MFTPLVTLVIPQVHGKVVGGVGVIEPGWAAMRARLGGVLELKGGGGAQIGD